MSTTKKTDIINSLLDLPEFEPETSAVKLPRLGIVLELRELPYDKLVRLSREQDAQIHLILSCVTNHPELKQAEWYKEKMKCATPADGLKRLLGRERWRRSAGPSTCSTGTVWAVWSPCRRTS